MSSAYSCTDDNSTKKSVVIRVHRWLFEWIHCVMTISTRQMAITNGASLSELGGSMWGWYTGTRVTTRDLSVKGLAALRCALRERFNCSTLRHNSHLWEFLPCNLSAMVFCQFFCCSVSHCDHICTHYTIQLFIDSSTCIFVHSCVITQHSYRRYIRNHGDSVNCIHTCRQKIDQPTWESWAHSGPNQNCYTGKILEQVLELPIQPSTTYSHITVS